MNNHYIYALMYDNKYLYIGMGKGNRIKHVLSGRSSNKYLNEFFVLDKDMSKVSLTKLNTGLRRDCALDKEVELIKEMRPLFNIEHNGFYRKHSFMAREFLDGFKSKSKGALCVKEKDESIEGIIFLLSSSIYTCLTELFIERHKGNKVCISDFFSHLLNTCDYVRKQLNRDNYTFAVTDIQKVMNHDNLKSNIFFNESKNDILNVLIQKLNC